uniref:Poly A polymerase head domain-containing protein n=1 Tax=Fagus sylvatica TaxID=28930 RepID=A0A2N9EF08_FAGSY
MTSATSPPALAPVVEVKERIELTEIERKIFDRLLSTLRHFDLTDHHHLRVAGGWVRDKLLGKDCYDIDIALDNMLGSEFVEKVRDYLLSTGEEVQGVAVIPCNPEQSKHLETARMRLFDMWIDFVNLRSEEYSDNSRIPTKQKFGTAEEDAYRRDLTINSLFYNINTDSVEDFTKRGIADLKSGKIVTPLPPKTTFLDDPLRVLRAIRFGARFGFLLDEELKEAASCDEVKDALAAKISRERIGVEIDLMISGNQPVKAMMYICDLMLFWTVFSLPPKFEPTKSEGCDRLCIAYLDATWNLIHLIGGSTFNLNGMSYQRCPSIYIPGLRELNIVIHRVVVCCAATAAVVTLLENLVIPVVNYIFRESLKRKVSDAETVVNVHSALHKFLSLIPFLSSDGDIQLIEVDWERGLDDVPLTSKLRHFQLDKQRDLFTAVESAITKLGLEKVWDVKPLVNGKDIMSVLQLKAGGPLIREWQQKLLVWQLSHPYGTTEEGIDWMRQTHSKRVKTE